MKSKRKKRLLSLLTAAAMTVSAFAGFTISASAAEYAKQAVDLSAFDAQGTYDSDTGVETLSLKSKAWSKLDLSDYTTKGEELVQTITISYTETVPSAGRTAIGFYDADLATYATNTYQDTTGAAVVYGIMGSNTDKRVYLNGDNKNTGTFSVDAEETVTLTFDLVNSTLSGSIGSQSISSSIDTVDSIDTMAIYSWSDCTYTISDMTITTITSDDVYYKVYYNIEGTTTYENVLKDSAPAEIPTPEKTGYDFIGWYLDDDETTVYTSDDVAKYTVTGSVTFTAVFERNTEYIEKIASVEISGADSLTFGSDENTAYANEYTVIITGDMGSIITEDDIDSRIDDFNVVWDVDGFATENDTDGQYCDSYGSITQDGGVSATFDLKQVSMNFYGKMTATITYNGETVTAEKYVVALGDTSTSSNQVLPEGGYPSDISDYPEAVVGYSAAASANNQTGSDLITGNFYTAGSDTGKSLTIVQDGDLKFFRFTKSNTGNSGMASHYITAPTGQITFVQDVCFNANGGCITFTAGYPIYSSSSSYGSAFALTYAGSAITLNDTTLTKDDNAAVFTTGTWYKVVISADKTTETCYALVYDSTGTTLLGEASNVAWSNSCSPTYYAFGLSNSYTGTIDISSYSAYTPVADTNSFALVASQDTLSIPNGDTATLTASLKDTNGYDMTGEASWTILEEDMQEGVTITPDESDSHTAVVTLDDSASAGTATVQVNIGGYTTTVELTITSSAESVKFTQSTLSVSIPLDADSTATATYAAVVVDGNGNETATSSTTLAVYDKTNTSEYTLPTGITFDADTGILTVTSEASACTFTIRATGTNSDGETISKGVKVTVHGLAFDFGEDSDEALVDGYTAVSASTSYTEARGYGISAGTATAGGTGDTEDADSDYLEGAITFKANVTSGKNYTVEITYNGTLTTGYVNSDLAGYTLGTQTELTTATYTVPAPDSALDFIVSGTDAAIASIVITKTTDKTAGTVPTLFDVGDSTVANSGSWAYVISHNLDNYSDLTSIVNFESRGRGSRNLSSYYTEGILAAILTDIKPGDIVMFGNMGTNGMGSYFEEDANYYIDVFESMGAKVILNSYTPHGAVGDYTGGYDSTTNTFTSYRQDSYDVIIRAIAAEREASDPNYLGFVDVGKMADASFNAYVADYAANDYESAGAAAQAIIACFGDHNHYSENSLACDLMLEGYTSTLTEETTPGIISSVVDILEAADAEYNVTLSYDETKGAVSVSSTTATQGDAVTVTVTPNDGYSYTISAVNAGGTEMTVTDGTFYMPASDVTVTVTFTEIVTSSVKVADYDTALGTVNVSADTAATGDTVTVTVTPVDGYTYSIAVTDADNNAVTVSNGKFTMPSSDVTVTVTFTAAADEPDTPETVENFAISDGAASADVTNTFDEALDTAVIIASYDENGALVEVKMTTQTIEVGGTVTLKTDALTKEYTSVKAFVWNMATYAPLADNI